MVLENEQLFEKRHGGMGQGLKGVKFGQSGGEEVGTGHLLLVGSGAKGLAQAGVQDAGDAFHAEALGAQVAACHLLVTSTSPLAPSWHQQPLAP